ncbi:tripartite tricarboxylate transporter TctB family protein [Alkalihalobacillus oceani]|uniref:Tripartite tricarboxylate transporter TctB family protein n=1 Tax=Halalkalibacter oceani TaxID=1653776 RepID=A0A9X2IM84_9BACI|nr:tripartite tricarboxylate transporter TctB family protein [Halalkalibacter oceani]MCM3712476.1 tripartite tricarboxylate transporter TctB family protein [Halalkalibacter oceani]
MVLKDQDVKLGILVIMISGLFLTQTQKLPEEVAMYPKAILYLMMISGVCIILRAFHSMKKNGKSYHRLSMKEFLLESGIPGAVLLALCLFLNVLGFYITSFFIVVAVIMVQEYIIQGRFHFRRKFIVKSFVFAGCAIVFMFICFATLLSLPTPVGIFGF